jgi:hypothetical protein
VTLLSRQRFRAHYNGYGVEAFRSLPSRHTVIGDDEGQRDEVYRTRLSLLSTETLSDRLCVFVHRPVGKTDEDRNSDDQ